MSPAILGVFIPIIGIIGAVTLIVFLRKYENVERMAMIERGINPGIAKPKTNPSGTLRGALLAIGAGLGLLVGNFLETSLNMDDGVAYFSMILLFGGIGLLIAYIIQLRQDEKEKREREREIV